jgi:hypothetical protein
MAEKQDNFNGVKCAGEFARARDYHSRTLIQEVLNSRDFQKSGWRIDLVRYNIIGGKGGVLDKISPDHTTLKLVNPNGREVTSLDVWSADTGTGVTNNYSDRSKMLPVLDDCVADNAVVLPEKETGRAAVIQGTGPEVFQRFVAMMEFANRVGLDKTYMRGPNDVNGGFNSNSLPHAAVLAVGLKYPDEFANLSGGDNWNGLFKHDVLPGKDRGPALRDLVMKDGPLHFMSVPPAEIADPKHRSNLIRVIDGLHLEGQQNKICREAGTPAEKCAVEMKP